MGSIEQKPLPELTSVVHANPLMVCHDLYRAWPLAIGTLFHPSEIRRDARASAVPHWTVVRHGTAGTIARWMFQASDFRLYLAMLLVNHPRGHERMVVVLQTESEDMKFFLEG